MSDRNETEEAEGPMSRGRAFISDEDRYQMRKLRSMGLSLRKIASQKGVSVRQVENATVGIECGKEYPEDALRANPLEPATAPEPRKPDMPSDSGISIQEGDEAVSQTNNHGNTALPQAPKSATPLVPSYEDIIQAVDLPAKTVLVMAAEAFRYGYSSVGAYFEEQVVPWMRFVNRVKEEFFNFDDPSEPITPEQFEQILDRMSAELRYYRTEYEELKAKVDKLLPSMGGGTESR